MWKRVYSDAERALWRQMRPALTVAEIVRHRAAAGVKVNYRSVWLETIDIAGPRGLNGKAHYVTGQERVEIRRLYGTYGWHLADIAERFGVSLTTARNHAGTLDALDLPTRKRQPRHLIHAPMADIAQACLTKAA